MLCISLTLTACSTTPENRSRLPQYDGTTANQVRPATRPDRPPPVSLIQGPRALVEARRIDFPLNADLEPAWKLANQRVYPALTAGVWANNGLRLGVIHRDDIPALEAVLPTPAGVSKQSLLATGHPLAIAASPSLQRTSVPIDLTIPPYQPNRVWAQKGRLQLLAQIESRNGLIHLVLTPHHYRREVRLLPTDPLTAELEGTRFHTLATRIPLPPGHLIIVGLYRPPAAPPLPPAQPNASTQPTTQPATQPRNAQPLPPLSLGRYILTGTRRNQELQSLLVIRVEEILTDP